MRRLFFFFRGESGQSGDSISVCCHKMAGQLFVSLATIKWICSTPLKVNDFTAFCDHACSERESNDSTRLSRPVMDGVRWCVVVRLVCSRHPSTADGRFCSPRVLHIPVPPTGRCLKLDCRRPSRTRSPPITRHPPHPPSFHSTSGGGGKHASLFPSRSPQRAVTYACNRGDGTGDGRTLQGTAKEWDR